MKTFTEILTEESKSRKWIDMAKKIKSMFDLKDGWTIKPTYKPAKRSTYMGKPDSKGRGRKQSQAFNAIAIAEYVDYAKDFIEKEYFTSEKKAIAKIKEMGIANSLTEAKGDKEAYQKFFEKMLKKYKVKSPEDLDTKKRKAFFAEVDKSWDAKNETD